MKSKILFCILFLLCLKCYDASAKCNCSVWVRIYNDGLYTQYWAGIQPLLTDVDIIQGDSLLFFVDSNRDCLTNSLLFTISGDTIFNGHAGDPDPPFSYTAYDTGHYYLDYFYYAWHIVFNFNVRYTTATGVSEIKETNPLCVWPTVSNGAYKINKVITVDHLVVTDQTGKIVFETRNKISEINLANLSSGLYFYQMRDTDYRQWNGKLIKQ